jgi:4-amino-4-deoxy-L-arabinose transferase-like glycosyltransferase
MTDVPFTGMLLAASLLYVRGLRSGQAPDARLLLLGSAFLAAATLARQYGILLAPAVLLSLWTSGRLNVKSALAASLVPALTLAAHLLWASAQPTPLVTYYLAGIQASIARYPWDAQLVNRLQRAAWALALPGLTLLPLLGARRPNLRLFAPAALLALLLGARAVLMGVGFFPISGNVLDKTGFFMDDYSAEGILTGEVWNALGFVGLLALCWYLCSLARPQGADWRALAGDPALALYAGGAMMAAALFIFTPFVFDRYFVPLMPALALPALRGLSAHRAGGRAQAAARLALALPMLVFAVALQAGYMAHAAARWESAQALVAAGVPAGQVGAGFEWEGEYNFAAGAARARAAIESGSTREVPTFPGRTPGALYLLSDGPLPGYEETARRAYWSPLGGGTRYVLTLRKR